MRGRGDRRDKDSRAKDKAARLMDRVISAVGLPEVPEGDTRDRRVGKLASVHSRPCSCHMCGNARKHYGAKSIKEEVHEEHTRQQLQELGD